MRNHIKILLDNGLIPSQHEIEEINHEMNNLISLLNQESPCSEYLSIPDFINTIKKSALLLRDLISNKDIIVAQYSFQTGCFEPIGDISISFFSNVKGPYTIDRLRKSPFIGQETVDDLNHFLDALCDGVPKGEVCIKVKNNSDWVWYHCTYSLLKKCNNTPSYAIILCKNITDIRSKVLAAQRFQDFMRVGKQKLVVETREVVLNVEYNLTNDTFESYDGELPEVYEVYKDVFESSYTHAIERISRDIIPPHREAFLRCFSRESMFDSFAMGKNYDVQEFLMVFQNENTWIRVLYQLLRDPYTSCINIWLSCRDVTEEKLSTLRLVQQAQFDIVTGLHNRAALIDRMNETCTPYLKGVNRAFIMLDIDGFGKVNDALGHAYGDRVLKDIAQTLKLVIDADDMVARIGGDEFGIYVNNCFDLDSAKERLRIIISALYRELNYGVKISASAGMALFPQDGDTFSSLYEKADIALSHAKITGRNKFSIYNPNMETEHFDSIVTPIHETNTSESNIYIRTFGYFDVFINGEAILIPNAKAKELLALLVDRRGGFVSSGEIISCLWEGEEANTLTLSRCRKVFMLLKNTLKEYNLENLIESKKGKRKINTRLVNCDLYNYLSGRKEFAHLFKGVYMMNYSWGELTFPELEELSNRSKA